MPTFDYIASNAKGESIRGTLSAERPSDVSKALREKGLFLVSCKSTEPLPDPVTLVLKSPTSPVSPRGKVSLKELAVLTRQLSISIRAGMSFVNTLQRMSQRAKNPATAFVLQSVLNDILAGKKVSEALAAHPTIFTPVYVHMIAAGEAGGFMPEALNRIADLLEKEIDLNSKIKSAMIYPAMIALTAMVVVTGVMLFVIPTFVRVFQEMNMTLPLPTRILISLSSFFRHGGFLVPVLFVGLFEGARRLRRSHNSFASWWDEKMLAIPIFGQLIILEVITRFIRTLASLVENGVMALSAIGMARQVVQNRAIEKVVDEMYASVQRGNGFSDVLYRSKYFPDLVADMVATGESTGSLPEVLQKMADYYDAEVSAAVRDILTMIEPLMIMVMAVVVGLIIAGLMLPMFTGPGGIGS